MKAFKYNKADFIYQVIRFDKWTNCSYTLFNNNKKCRFSARRINKKTGEIENFLSN